MPINDAVPGGQEPAKSPMERHRSILGANISRQSKRILTDDIGRLRTVQEGSSNAGVLNNGAVSNVTANTVTTVATFTASTAASNVMRVSCSGTNYAKFSLVLNTSTIEVKRTGPDRNLEFGNIALALNDVLEVKVEHYIAGELNNFEATIYGV